MERDSAENFSEVALRFYMKQMFRQSWIQNCVVWKEDALGLPYTSNLNIKVSETCLGKTI
jgi:hypothetical protein